jgi:hypothetical protein
VRALAVGGRTLYVGGDFSTVAGTQHNHLGAVDTASGAAADWAQDADDSVDALSADAGGLRVGGEFRTLAARAAQSYGQPPLASPWATPRCPSVNGPSEGDSPAPTTSTILASQPGSASPRAVLARAPEVLSFSLTHTRFRVGHRATALVARSSRRVGIGTTFRYTLTSPARVVLAIARLRGHRTPGLIGTLVRASQPGPNRLFFTGRLGRRALRPGIYRATLTALGFDGQASRPRRLAFTVVAR